MAPACIHASAADVRCLSLLLRVHMHAALLYVLLQYCLLVCCCRLPAEAQVVRSVQTGTA